MIHTHLSQATVSAMAKQSKANADRYHNCVPQDRQNLSLEQE